MPNATQLCLIKYFCQSKKGKNEKSEISKSLGVCIFFKHLKLCYLKVQHECIFYLERENDIVLHQSAICFQNCMFALIQEIQTQQQPSFENMSRTSINEDKDVWGGEERRQWRLWLGFRNGLNAKQNKQMKSRFPTNEYRLNYHNSQLLQTNRQSHPMLLHLNISSPTMKYKFWAAQRPHNKCGKKQISK